MSSTVDISSFKQEHAPHKAQFNRQGTSKFPLKTKHPIHECVLRRIENNDA
jgi:hypothetical protein